MRFSQLLLQKETTNKKTVRSSKSKKDERGELEKKGWNS
jgi:hypothetical protein